MIPTRSLPPSLVQGYRVAGPRYYPYSAPVAGVSEVAVFIQRSAECGRRWLRFVQRLEPLGHDLFWVTAHRTLREAVCEGKFVRCKRQRQVQA